jgi:hypothetical protein
MEGGCGDGLMSGSGQVNAEKSGFWADFAVCKKMFTTGGE